MGAEFWSCLAAMFSLVIFCYLIQLHNDILRLNRKVNKLAEHMGLADNMEPLNDEAFKELIMAGEKIKAIKRYRQLTGEGLKEASDYVDALLLKNK
ncbi:MAG TPA: 50S ribosomal protein L7/L12 [Defluviitaleaceae bacterium]|nr:50S ribosomal protein L7/L12 [Defluviitaleaceae bacterium]HQD49683.1 50S ribosomal protein L7/L12 [Defluviitaleaceae bacterium]